jgi:hypothetical protein
MNAVQLAEGQKYALIALPRLNAITESTGLAIAEEGFALATTTPVTDLTSWKSTFGWYRYNNLAEAGHYLIVYARSKAPGILNHENKALERRLHRFHLGVLIACPFIAYEEAVFVEGARRNGFTDIRGHTTYDQVTRIAAGPGPYLRSAQLRYGLELGRATKRVRRSPAGDRFGRVLAAFRAGLHARALDDRIHQFARCVEAFLGSWRKEEFADRAVELFTGVSHDNYLTCYQIRSAAEHFGDWKRVVKVAGDRAKEERLILHAMEMQAAAHLVVSRFLDTPALWPHYVDEATVRHLFKNMSSSDRRTLWGVAIDLSSIRRVNLSAARAALD